MKKIIFLLVVMSVTLSAQDILSPSDSLLFAGAQNDTSKLRSLTTELGSPLAKKAHYALGLIKFNQGDYYNAKAEFQVLNSFYANDLEGIHALYFLGRIAVIENDLLTGKNLYEQYIQKDPAGELIEEAKYYRIVLLNQLGDKSELSAIYEFLNEFPADGTYTNHVHNYLVNYLKDNNLELAIKEAKKFVAAYPNSEYTEDMTLQIGEMLYEFGKPEEAKNHFRMLVSNNKANTVIAASAQFLLAECFEKDGDYKTAYTEYSNVALNHGSVGDWKVLSEYSKSMLNYLSWETSKDTSILIAGAEDVIDFIKNNKKSKYSVIAMSLLGQIYTEVNDYESALKAYDKIKNIKAKNLKDISDEEKSYLKNIYLKSFFLSADIYKNKLFDYKKAYKEYNSVLKIDPENMEALFGKALMLIEGDREEDAIPLLQYLVDSQTDLSSIALTYLEKFELKEGGN